MKAWLFNPADTEERLENPSKRRRKGRKVRRSARRGGNPRLRKGSREAKAYMARLRSMVGKRRRKSSRRRRNWTDPEHKKTGVVFRGGGGRFAKTGNKRLKRHTGGGWYGNPRRRRRSGRRRNPDLGGMVSATAQVAPFKFPGSGIIGKLGNNVVQGVAGGLVFFTGYFSSGAMVDYVASPADALRWAQAGDWRAKWARPLLFGMLSGVVGTGTAWVAKRAGFKNSTIIAAIAAAGPGVRAFAGLVAAILPAGPADSGFLADMKRAAVGLADYLQMGGMGDYLQMGDTGDYLQMGEGDDDEMGEGEELSDIYAAGEGEDVADSVNAAVGDFDDNGFGEGEEFS
jgi:hypothetical protein